jgi:prolyl-tRNA editing enzyme YbaK/EbsC (Cys-tRNA(Pro) deacylase)
MHPRAAEFTEQARERYGVTLRVEEFPGGTKTAADAATAVGCDVAQIASSLAFSTGTGEDGLVVVVTSGANRVSENRLADHLGCDAGSVSMADPDRISETLGWSIGGVPPFCHATAVPVLFDETLLSFEQVWAAAGTPEAVFPMAPDEIRALADAQVATVTE